MILRLGFGRTCWRPQSKNGPGLRPGQPQRPLLLVMGQGHPIGVTCRGSGHTSPDQACSQRRERGILPRRPDGSQLPSQLGLGECLALSEDDLHPRMAGSGFALGEIRGQSHSVEHIPTASDLIVLAHDHPIALRIACYAIFDLMVRHTCIACRCPPMDISSLWKRCRDIELV